MNRKDRSERIPDATAHTRSPPGPSTAGVAGRRQQAAAGHDDGAASTQLDAHFHEHFRETPYYSSGRDWDDYAPAYQYGYATRDSHRHGVFADVENALAEGWEQAKDASRLCWAEARGAVEDAWRHVDSTRPTATRHLGPAH